MLYEIKWNASIDFDNDSMLFFNIEQSGFESLQFHYAYQNLRLR